VWVIPFLSILFYIIQANPTLISYLHFAPHSSFALQPSFARQPLFLPFILYLCTAILSSLANQIIPFVFIPITINHYIISAHYLSFFSGKTYLLFNTPLFAAIESTLRLLID